MHSALNEYAITFNTLLYEGYKIRNGRDLRLVNLISAAFSDDKKSKEFIKQLEWAAQEPDAILNRNGTPTSKADLHRFFKGM